MATLSPTRWSRFKTRRNGSQTRTGTTSTSLTRDSDERNILKNLIFINKSLSFWDAVLQLVGIWFLRKWLVYIKLTEGAQLAFGLGFTTPVNWMNFSISPNKSMSFAKEAAQNFVVFSASSRRPRLSWQRGNCWGPLWTAGSRLCQASLLSSPGARGYRSTSRAWPPPPSPVSFQVIKKKLDLPQS